LAASTTADLLAVRPCAGQHERQPPNAAPIRAAAPNDLTAEFKIQFRSGEQVGRK